MNSTAQVIEFNDQKIVAYDEFRSQLAELKTANEKAVFDYESPKGNKEARSHVYKLRQTKTAIDKARKEQKKASLDYGRRVDAQAKEIIDEVEEMIEVHQKPIDEIEQREKDRVARHEGNISALKEFINDEFAYLKAEDLKVRLTEYTSKKPDESYEEFELEARKIYDDEHLKLKAMIVVKDTEEKEAARLEFQRKEAEESARKERERIIAEQAAENARKEAESLAAEELKQAQEKAEQEAIKAKQAMKKQEEQAALEVSQAKARVAEAELKAAQAKQAAEDEQRAKEENEIAAAAQREADKKHKAFINNQAKSAFVSNGFSDLDAEKIVKLIAKKEITNVTISY